MFYKKTELNVLAFNQIFKYETLIVTNLIFIEIEEKLNFFNIKKRLKYK
jgi:hypothetical protein